MDKRATWRLGTGLGLAIACGAIGIGVVRAGDTKGEGLVDRLDYVFQERFRSTEGNFFGLSRIPVTPEHRRVVHWKPDQELEKKVAQDLKTRGLAGAFLLSVPGLAKDEELRITPFSRPREKVLNETPDGRNGISRPILLSEGDAPAPLPTYGELLPGIKKAEETFANGDQTEFAVRDWKIFARPIRATQECIRCHEAARGQKGLKPGSVLGVAMYAFASADPKREAKAP